MTDYDDDRCALEDDEECENIDCEQRELYYVTVSYEVTFEVRAHDYDEASDVAGEQYIGADQLYDYRVAEWTEVGYEVDIESHTERSAYEQRIKEAMAKEAS